MGDNQLIRKKFGILLIKNPMKFIDKKKYYVLLLECQRIKKKILKLKIKVKKKKLMKRFFF